MIWGPNPNAAKTFILQFIYKGGNGWAFVNAPTINKAVEIFTSQTKFKEAHVTNIKETKYYGQNIQICFEGAVTTIPIIANEITVDKELNSNSYNPIANAVVAGKFKSFTDKFSAIYEKQEIDALLREKINKNDLSRVAFSGSYKDLLDMPYIPPAYDDTDIKARITELEEAGFITDFTEQDPTVPDWAKSPHKPTYTASEVGALPDSTVIPVIPTKVSAFTNDVGYLTSFTETDPTIPAYIKAITPQDIANWNSKTSNIGTITGITMNGVSKGTSGVVDLGTVLTSHQSLAGYATTQYVDNVFNNLIGSAPAVLDTLEELAAALGEDENFATTITNQLSNKVDKVSGKGLSTNDYTTADRDKLAGIAAGAEVNVNADWDATSGDAQILNKPTLFSGDYNDLINKPSIPSAYDDTSLSNRVLILENAGFITTETDPTVPSWAKQSTKPSYDYSEINNTPTIPTVPTNVSAFTNDAGYLTTHQDISGKQDVLTAGDGIAIDNSDTIRTVGIPYGKVDSTSTSTVFTATVPGIDRLEDGVCVLLKNGVVTSAKNFTININGLGAKHCYTNMAAATMESTIFNVNYTMLFVYDSTRVTGGGWICYRGYDSDTNTNTVGYLLRGNNSTMKTTDASRYYKIFFTSADGTHWVPASVNSTNNATSARPVNQRPIDPFGRIMYTSANTNYPAGSIIAVATLWSQYPLSLGYSFNRTGAELTLTASTPVYVKCTPQTDGSAIIDADVPYVQALPTTNDGKIYIFLGIAYNATNIELYNNHPVYYHDGTGLRMWTGSAGSSTDLSNYYTKTEIDTMIGDIETLLASI